MTWICLSQSWTGRELPRAIEVKTSKGKAEENTVQEAAIEKMYMLDGGLARVEDGSIYSPGVNVGVPMTVSCNARLISHRAQWLMWDAGIQDALVREPGGRIIAHGIRGIPNRSIVDQLREIEVDPGEIRMILLSHAHFDHVGNVDLFRNATWIAQRTEFEAMFGPRPDEFGYLPDLYAVLKDRPYDPSGMTMNGLTAMAAALAATLVIQAVIVYSMGAETRRKPLDESGADIPKLADGLSTPAMSRRT